MNTNYYKIVETIESGKSLLSPVPQQWECNGKLMWPPQKTKEKAMKNPWAPPGSIKDGWAEYTCILKRSFIPTYSQALKEIRAMSDRSDTSDAEAAFTPPASINIRTPGARKIVSIASNPDNQRLDLNKFVNEKSNNEIVDAVQPDIAPIKLCRESQLQQEQQMFVVEDKGQIQFIPTDSAEQTDVAGMLVAVAESVAKLQARIDHSIRLQEQILIKLDSNIQQSAETTSNVPNLNTTFELIDTIDQLIAFETNLGNTPFVEQLCPQLYSICGPNSNQTGDNACYKFVDIVFSRHLFTQVSWTGQSRNQKKENFSRFVHTFKFFYHLIKRCDPNYTESNLKDFFQKIINNSKRRFETVESASIRRASAVKHHGMKRCRRDVALPSMSNDDCDQLASAATHSTNDDAEETIDSNSEHGGFIDYCYISVSGEEDEDIGL